MVTGSSMPSENDCPLRARQAMAETDLKETVTLTSLTPDQWQLFLDSLAVPAFVVSVSSQLAAVNALFEQQAGNMTEALHSHPFIRALPASAAGVLQGALERCTISGARGVCEVEIRGERQILHWRVTLAPLLDNNGATTHIMGTVEDQTALYETRQTLYRSERRLFSLGQGAAQGIVVHHFFRPLFANEAAANLFGFDSVGDFLRIGSLLDLVPDAASHPARTDWKRFMRRKSGLFSTHAECRGRDGGLLWIDYRSTAVDWDGMEAEQAAIFDVTERHRLIESLKLQAATDALTGLLNRDRFLAIAEHAVEDSRVSGQGDTLRIAMIDIDHFKGINDTYGHAAGDEALRKVATVLKGTFRESDVMARFGGEEFAVLFPGATEQSALHACERARQSCADADIRVWGNRAVHLTVSCGLSGALGPGDSIDAGLRDADRALYAAKVAGRNRVAVADAGFIEVWAP